MSFDSGICGKLRVGVVGVQIRVGKLLGLDEHVPVERRLRTECREVDPQLGRTELEDVEHFQYREPLRIGRKLVHIVAMVIGADRRHPIRPCSREVGRSEGSAERAGFRQDGRCDLAPVERITSLRLQDAKRTREILVAKHTVGGRRLAAHQVGLDRIGVRPENLGTIDPITMDAFSDGESLLGKSDRRLQQLFEAQSSGPFEQDIPGIHRARNGDRVDAMLRHLLRRSARGEVLRRRSGGRAAAAVQSHQLLLLRQPRDHEDIAADSRTARFNDVHDGRRRHRRVDGIAAVFQYLQTCLRGQRLAGSHHSISRQDLGARLRQPAARAITAGRGEFGGLVRRGC